VRDGRGEDNTPSLHITPLPTPEEAAAIMAALHAHRHRQAAPTTGTPSRWLVAARRQALRTDWATVRASSWRHAARPEGNRMA
jgi:hypothetical protein